MPTADGFQEAVEGVSQESVGLQIRVNATSAQEPDEWILLYDEGPRTFYIGSPQQSDPVPLLPPQQRDNSLQ